jgi:predicted phosphoribosyltransferase
MGAVIDGAEPSIVRNDDVIAAVGISEADFQVVCKKELAEIERRRKRYLGNRAPVDIAGRTAIVVDDGVATGATTRAALMGARRRKPKKLILAVPVAPADTLDALRGEVDELVCLESYLFFGAIGAYYRDFSQVEDEEVVALLEEAVHRKGAGSVVAGETTE